MAVAVIAMHTASTRTVLLGSLLNNVQICLNSSVLTDTQAIDVTFDFMGTRVRCVVSGSTSYQMNFF